MGANLVAGGATFRVWAPRAREVYIRGDFNGWSRDASSLLVKNATAAGPGSCPERRTGTSTSSTSSAKAPKASSATPTRASSRTSGPIPTASCARPTAFPWQDWGWRTPEFRDLIVYQFHVGTWYGPNREQRVAKFLDVLDRLEYLADLGVNAIEPLPMVEYSTPRSMGYNGSDLFSPEMDYQVGDGELDGYLGLVNRLLTQKGKAPLTRAMLAIGINQLKAMVDICHHYGIAVIFDVVYNHASGDIKGQPESIYFFDRAAGTNPNDSLYFTDQDHTGPVFAFWNQDVRQFLIDNAKFFVDEYHVDGFRYDQVTVIDQQNVGHGWLFCQDLNATLNPQDPSAINIAEYWGPEPAVVRPQNEGGAGFHANWHDGLRRAIRGVIGQASGGQDAGLDWQPVVEPASRARLSRRMARRPVRGEPRRGLSRPRAAHSVACRRRREHPDLACDEPLARRHGPAPDRARDSDALHGPGVLRGQALGRRPAEPPGDALLLGWSRVTTRR